MHAWLLRLPREDRRAVGEDFKTVQFGWPVGMPLVRKLEPGLWEVRTRAGRGAARVVCTVEQGTMVLLHGLLKRSPKAPATEIAVARQRLARLRAYRR